MKTPSKGYLLSIAVSALVSSFTPARATVYTWTNTGPISDYWNNTANWAGGLSPVGTTGSDTVRFFANSSTLITGNIYSSNNIGNLLPANQFVFSGKGGASSYGITTAGNSLQLAGTNPSLVMEATSGTYGLTYTINNAIQLTANSSITSPGSATFNIGGVISGTGALTIDASGIQLTLLGASTYHGATTLTAGTLYLGATNALPTTTGLTIASGATVNLNTRNQGAQGGNQTLASLSGSGTLTNGNDTVTRTLTINGGTASTFAGALTAGYSTTSPDRSRLALVISGNAQLTLTGTGSNYTGPTTVNAGSLEVDGALAATPVTVNSGGLLCGTGTLAGTVSVNAGGMISSGDETVVGGILTTGSQTWNNGGAVFWTVNSGTGTAGTNWDQFNVNGTLTISATNTNPAVVYLNTYSLSGTAGPMDNFNTWTSGTWPILAASGSIANFSQDTVALDVSGVKNPTYLEGLPLGDFGLVSGTNNQMSVVYTPNSVPAMGVYGGAYGGSNPIGSGILSHERWLGQPISMGVDNFSYNFADWSVWEGAARNLVTRNCAERNRHVFVYAPSMVVSSTDGNSMSQGASGAYNSHWTYLAQQLVAGGCGDAIIRPGHEMNGGWYPWKISSSSAATNYKNYWIQIVNTMRAVSPNFKFCFCVANGNPNNYNQYLLAAYPGDAYVDYIGIDIYDTWNNDRTPGDRWGLFLVSKYADGLDYWVNYFSTTKPLCIPEWGLWATGGTSGGNGDDDYFTSQMYKWVTNPTNRVAFSCYFDYGVSKISASQFPSSAAMYLDTFGQAQFWDQEIGTVSKPGITLTGTSTITVKGSGAGIGGAFDNFHFTFTPTCANTSMTARITSISGTDPNAVAGVMMREDLNPGTEPTTTINTSGTGRYVFAGMKNGNVIFQYRDTSGNSGVTSYTTAATLPLWVRIVRSGTAFNVFTGYTSTDGTTWTSIASQTIASDTNGYMGFAVASGSSSAMNIASFDNVNNMPVITMDNSDASGVIISGSWITRTDEYDKNGANCLGNGNVDPNTYVRFTPTIVEPGNYNVYLCYSTTNARPHATNVPLTVVGTSGTASLTVDQTWDFPGYPYYTWHPVGTFQFSSGTNGYVQINTVGTTAEVIADAVRFKKVLPAPPN